MEALARSGHFAQVVIADGNLPVGAMNGPNSVTVHLNFRPGLLDALTVLEGILEVCPAQGAIVMEKPKEANAEIHESYKKLLGDVTWEEMERWAFYDQVRDQNTTLIIQTGEQAVLRGSATRKLRLLIGMSSARTIFITKTG